MKQKKVSGILLHPTSFPSKFGIGDLGQNAYEFIDFLKKSNQSLWQILPLGTTSFKDSPYQSFSAFAGNILLISPAKLLESNLLTEQDLENVENFDICKIDYGQVITYKQNLFKKSFSNFKNISNEHDKIKFNEFCNSNSYWLDDFALFLALKQYFIKQRKQNAENFNFDEFEDFCKKHNGRLDEKTLKDYYYGAVWSTWENDIANRKPEAIEHYTKLLEEEIELHKFNQYIFFEQWISLKTYANDLGIRIIGDIPIFVAYDSSDVWTNKNLFFLDNENYPSSVAGVPPDYFSKTGQLWGNPLYNWNAHKKNNYSWWVDRIKNTLVLVDLIRVDHFRGFEAFWSIPYGQKTAINGEWKKGPGKDLFIELKKQIENLPIIAEDLGIITSQVEELRDLFEFPGMRILQFAFDDKSTNAYLPINYIQNTVVYTGTHDNATLLGWYESLDKHTKELIYNYFPNFNIYSIDKSYIVQFFIELAYDSIADFVIIPLQDILLLGDEARMNTPGTENNNWQWRYTYSMLSEEKAQGLYDLTQKYNRNNLD